MKKRGAIALLLLILLVPCVLASSVDDEIKKLTHYAEEYETGNINYAQLTVYASSIRENVNHVLGAVESHEGGLLKQDQIRDILGEPDEYTKWVWVEGEDQDKKLDEPLPRWRRLVFDGKKIQIRLEAHPSMFIRKDREEIIYRLNFNIEFKKPGQQINIQGKIAEVKSLAEAYASDPTFENAEKLAKESFNTERAFESSYKQSSGNCEDLMNSIFGSENKYQEQKILVQEVEFYEAEDFEAVGRLELCEECEWKWINLNMWLEGRNMFNKQTEPQKKQYADFEAELANILEKMKIALDNRDFDGFNRLSAELWPLNDEWNKQSNDLWDVVEQELDSKRQQQEQNNQDPYWWIEFEKQKRERIRELQEVNYQKRKKLYELLFSGYEKKEFFFEETGWQRRLVEEFEVVSDQELCDNSVDDNGNGEIDCQEDKCGGKICGWNYVEIVEESSVEPLVEVVVESSLETDVVVENTVEENGDNNIVVENTVEENGDNNIVVENIVEGGILTGNVIEEIEEPVEEETQEYTPRTKKVPLYCIAKTCQMREEDEEKKAVCGNHICEENEICAEDCSICLTYPALECEGKVIFSGEDKNGCPLEPVCIEEKEFCETTEDCGQPLCGKSECQEGRCTITELDECEEAECIDGDEKTQTCSSGEKKVIEICESGSWISTGVQECSEVEEVEEDEVVGNECEVRTDCGNQNDVCSNGKCVTLPEKETTVSEPPVVPETTSTEPEPEPEPSDTSEQSEEPANQTITGEVITGYQVEETETTTTEPEPEPETPEPTSEPEPSDTSEQSEEPVISEQDYKETEGFNPDYNEEDREQQQAREEQKRQEEDRRMQQDQEENERRQEEDRERKIQECKEESNRRCEERYINDCIGRCVFEDNQVRELEECKEECKLKNERDISDCVARCDGVCETGEWCEIDFSPTHTKEKIVFNVGGTCRNSPTETQAFIYFDGWGDSGYMSDFQKLKNQYYRGHESDWCKWEVENILRQREEMEKSFNQKFAVWFFEKHLANSAEDWDQHMSGIHELYWENVEIQRRLAEMSGCSGVNPPFNLINFSYDTEYGSVEYWEELQTVKFEFLEEPVIVASPYMRLWASPPKEFIKFEMQKSMEEGEFPGPPEDKLERGNEEGLTEEEKQSIREDESFMKKIRKLSEKYGGTVDGVMQVKDHETGEIVFNLYVQVNEQDLFIIKPMSPEDVPQQDVSVTLDFDKIHELILISEKDMGGEQVQNPPWDKGRIQPVKRIKEVINGIRMYFKVRDLINSAEYYPPESEGEIKSLIYDFMFKHMKNTDPGEGGDKLTDEEQEQAKKISDEVLGSKEVLTGEVILAV